MTADNNLTPDSPDPLADLAPQLREQVNRYRELRERGERARQELAEVRATVRSSTGAVTVTVGAGGVLHGVDVSEQARKLAPAKLSVEIMTTYRRAAQDVAEKGVEIMSALVGPDSPTLQLIRDAIPAEPEADDDGIRR
jgi:DNA-binding protein YbaB